MVNSVGDMSGNSARGVSENGKNVSQMVQDYFGYKEFYPKQIDCFKKKKKNPEGGVKNQNSCFLASSGIVKFL